MSSKLIAIIIFIVIYLIFLLITFILTYFYQIKNKDFIEFNKKYLNEWNKYKFDNKNSTLNQIDFKYQLPENEIGLFQKELLISGINQKIKDYKDYFDDDYLVLKKSLSLYQTTSYDFKQVKLYLTNLHLVIDDNNQFYKYKISEIKSCSICVIRDKNLLQKGCVLKTNDQNLTILGDVFLLVLSIKKLKKEF
ncbi:hypothetical protein V2P57_01470 [Mycoplasma mycoides subsp. mycoides]|uniref:Transmembrane protein n=3 Tax=Mycoplasma mycoides TaxID=2102 RepID=A0AAE2JSZ5_MYCMY|nr:hypothetical protein [Mycoplasma mycoides]CAE76933.1 hypothetical transmembrane protein [Mycoplasma mycoides subsp. mycoides SC str. PG1]ADK69767.1 conserved hypothetical protein [Mycoplasma mycoides subsp. mycoides SC str. Gladysdale]AIZ55146.1 hypothetical protein mycmycITA_00317 [Mycoplasma mycoides subsp. mycoides]AME10496.1 hypothetical protein MmmBen_0315 [Mycoplasma mycoides subsp. mycoides]AME11504.1 hypothetical protein MmmBen50_0310 [Mycoplasma mycoides subsp. mycoides]